MNDSPPNNKEMAVNDVNQHTEILQQLKKLSEHIGFLEKKLDQLLESKGNLRAFGGPPDNRFGGHREGGFRPRRPDHGTRTAYYQGGGGRHYSGKPFGNRPKGHDGPRREGGPRPSFNKGHGPRNAH